MGNRLCACFGGGGQSADVRHHARKALAAGAADEAGGAGCAAGATLNSIVQHTTGDAVRRTALGGADHAAIGASARAAPPARARTEPHRPCPNNKWVAGRRYGMEWRTPWSARKRRDRDLVRGMYMARYVR